MATPNPTPSRSTSSRPAIATEVPAAVGTMSAMMPPTGESSLVLDGIVAGYGDVEVLHGVDLAVPKGLIVALLGANGAGKSTLCAVSAGLVEPTAGRILLEGRDITADKVYPRRGPD